MASLDMVPSFRYNCSYYYCWHYCYYNCYYYYFCYCYYCYYYSYQNYCCLTWCLVFQLRSVGLKRGRHCQVGIVLVVLVLLVQLAHCVHCACTMFQQRHCPAVRHQQQLQERHCDDRGDVGNIVIKSDDTGDIVIKWCAS